MCMKLQAMGFACTAAANTAEILAKLAAKPTRVLPCSRGEYRLWQSTAGAQLWFEFPSDPGGDKAAKDAADVKGRPAKAMGLTPFHIGASKVTIRVERAQSLDKANPLKGSIRATIRSPDAAGPHPQLRLEMVPYARQRRARRPFRCGAQIVGFAVDVLAFETLDDYFAAMAPSRLIAPGAMAAVRENEIDGLVLGCEDTGDALGLVTGRIERAQRLVNPVTGIPYYWLVLKTNVGLIDIVTSPDAVSGDVSVGHIAHVCASFVGRLLETPTK